MLLNMVMDNEELLDQLVAGERELLNKQISAGHPASSIEREGDDIAFRCA